MPSWFETHGVAALDLQQAQEPQLPEVLLALRLLFAAAFRAGFF